jgi:hypothetical protein
MPLRLWLRPGSLCLPYIFRGLFPHYLFKVSLIRYTNECCRFLDKGHLLPSPTKVHIHCVDVAIGLLFERIDSGHGGRQAANFAPVRWPFCAICAANVPALSYLREAHSKAA